MAIVRKMYLKGYIGAKHTPTETVLRNIKDKNPRKHLQELIKANIVIAHPTSYGQQISLNFDKIKDIKEFLSID